MRRLMHVGEAALLVDPAGLATYRGEQRVIEPLGAINVVAADHDVTEHVPLLAADHGIDGVRTSADGHESM